MSAMINGQVGIKFVAKMLFASYEAVLASKSFSQDIWKSGDPSAIEAWKVRLGSPSISSERQVMSMLSSLPDAPVSYETVCEKVSLEDRGYMDLYDRRWQSSSVGPKRTSLVATDAADPSSKVKDIQTNSYPYAHPVITRDGGLLAYLSDSNSTDVNDTRASWALRDGSGYADQGALPMLSAESYADNNLVLDGTAQFAVAAWEQQRTKLPAGGDLEAIDLISMMNSSDILVSIYDGAGWSTMKLTDNLAPDLAPAVAARGDHAFVAWRNLAGVTFSGERIQYGNISDTIVYKTYNRQDNSWSAAHTLYNGASGNVKALQTAMLSDGTAAVVYTVDVGTLDSNPAYGYETYVAVVDRQGNQVNHLRLTNNFAIDQNPQVAAVDFGAGGEKFVLGWRHVVADGVSDIMLAAVNGDGSLYADFIDSLNSVEAYSAVQVNDSFQFVKGEDLQLSDLAMLWVEPSLAYNKTIQNDVERDILRAVRFILDSEGGVSLTAALDVATMDDHTVIDHFDAYTVGANKIEASLLANAYTGAVQFENNVFTVDSISSMKFVHATYRNDIDIRHIDVNYREIKHDFLTAFQFTIVNTGVDHVDSARITIAPDGLAKTFDHLNLAPNEAAVLRFDYDVPSAAHGIHDLQYTLDVNFNNGGVVQKNGLLNLDAPDLGVAKLTMLSDGQAVRSFLAALHNMNDIRLAEDRDRNVFVGIYTSPTYSSQSELHVQQLTEDELQLLDEASLTLKFTYQVPESGIPVGGIRIYTRVWAEERQQDGSYAELAEYDYGNNARSILYPNPIEENNGESIRLRVEQEGGLL